jgi:predicted acetyltransferase
VLVTCEGSNVGSSAVIEACGGRLVDSAVDGSRVCRHWID